MNGQQAVGCRGARIIVGVILFSAATAICLAAWGGLPGCAAPPGGESQTVVGATTPAKPAPDPAKPAPVPKSYTILDLGTLGGDSHAMGLNSKGQVVGYCGQYRAFLWDAGGGMRDIGPDGNEPCMAVGINDSGLVIGHRTRAYAHRAFVWDANSGCRDLGTLDAPESACCGVNNSGVVVGSLYHQSDSAFLYEGPGEMRKLTEVGQDRMATAINDEGAVAGYRNYAEAWIWHPKTGRKDIGLCRGSQAVPYRINRHNQVVGVGYSGDRGYEPHVAWLWDANGGMRPLGTLGGAQSEAYSINDAGHVVGMAQAEGDKPRAFLYAGGKMIDLNSLLPPGCEWELLSARDINSRGQIVGWGLHDGKTRAFLLTPRTE